MSKSLFDNVPEPIFGKNESTSLVATEGTAIDNPDQFEDIGQTTFTATWDVGSRRFGRPITFSEDPGTINDATAWEYQVNTDTRPQTSPPTPLTGTWSTYSNVIISSSGTGTERTVETTFTSTVPIGNYRIVLKANAFGTGKPSSDIPTTRRYQGRASTPDDNFYWGRPTYNSSNRSITATLTWPSTPTYTNTIFTNAFYVETTFHRDRVWIGSDLTVPTWRVTVTGSGRTRTVTATPPDSEPAGRYRILIRDEFFADDAPDGPLVSHWVSIGSHVGAISTYSASWGRVATRSRIFRATSETLTLSEDPGSSLCATSDFQVWGLINTRWQPVSGFVFSASGSGTTRTIIIKAGSTVPAGTYRVVLKAQAFGTDKPHTFITGSSGDRWHLDSFIEAALWGTPSYCQTSNRVTTTIQFYIPFVNFAGLTGSDFLIQNADGTVTFSGWTHSIAPANPALGLGHTYVITSTPASGASGTFKIVLRSNSVTDSGISGPPANIDSSTFTIAASALTVTWGTPAYCVTSNRLTTTITFNQSITGFTQSDIQVRNSANTGSVTGWSHVITGSGTSYTVSTTPPRQINASFRLRLLRNSIRFGTTNAPASNIDTTLFTLDSRKQGDLTDMPAITIDSGEFDSSARTITWVAYITGSTPSQVGSLSSADTTISNSVSTGATFTPTESVTRIGSGSSYRITTSAIPTNRSGDMSVTIRANALGSNSNPFGVTSGCVFYDTRTPPDTAKPSITIGPGNFCPTNRKVTWRVFVSGASSTQFAALTTADITHQISSGTGTSPAITNRGGNSLSVETTIAANRTGTATITIRANALGTDTNDSVTSSSVSYDTTSATVATATWGTPSAQTGIQATLQGRITFATTTNVQDIEPGDFDVIVSTPQGNVVHPESSWTIQVSHSYTDSSRAYIDVTAIPNGTFVASFGLRLRASSVRSDDSTTNNAPTANVDSSTISFNNRGTDTPPSITIDSGSFCPTSRRITWNAYITNASSTQIAALDAADVTITHNQTASQTAFTPTETVTRQPSTGASYQIQTTQIPANRSGTMYITIRANALGSNSNEYAVRSATVSYNTIPTIPDRPSITIDGGNFCPTSRRITWNAYITNASSTQIAALGADDVTITHNQTASQTTFTPTETVTRQPSTGASYQIQTTQIPTNRSGEMYITIRANALGSNSNEYSIRSATVVYNTIPMDDNVPSIVIDRGTFCPTNRRIVWNAYITGASSTEISAFTNADVTITNNVSSGADFTPTDTVSRTPSTGTSFIIQSSIIPTERVGTMYVSIAANALGTGTNLAVRSGTVDYDTRAAEPTPLIATWSYASYCQTSNRVIAAVRFNKAVTGLNVGTSTNTDIQIANDQKSANLTGWTLAFSGHTGSGTNASLAANTDLRITVTPPDDTNTNIYLLVNMNSVTAGTQTGPSAITYSEVIPVNNEPGLPTDVTPTITIGGGTYCPTSRKIVWNAYVVNANDTELGRFTNADVRINNTVSNGANFTPTDTLTRAPSTGDSFRIETSVIPTERVGEMSATIVANALGSGTNRSVTSGCVSYDTRTVTTPLTATWSYASYCETSDRVIAGLRFNKAVTGLDVRTSTTTDIRVANDQKSGNLTGWTFAFSGYTAGNPDSSSNKSLAANTDLRIEARPPANTNANVYMLVNMNAVTAGTESGPSSITYSEVIPVNNVPDTSVPSITIDGGSFCPTSRRITWNAYITNASSTQISALDAADVVITHNQTASQTAFTPTETVTRAPSTGASYQIQTTQIPTNRSGEMYITIRANALGTSSNPYAVRSATVVYNTFTMTSRPSITIGGGNFCPTSKRITWNAYITGASSTEISAFTNADVTITNNVSSGADFTPTDTVTRTPSTGTSFQIQSSVIPDERVGTMYLSVAANALGTGTNLAVRSETVSYDTSAVVDPLIGTWIYANWCETSNRVIAGLQFNKAISRLDVRSNSGDIQIANDNKSANLTGWTLSFSGHTGSANLASLAANTTLAITATPPTDTNVNIYMMVVANSIRVGSDNEPPTNIYSEVISVDNTSSEAPPPSITIGGGNFCPTSKRITWNVYINNASSTEITAFTNADTTITNSVSSGADFTPTDTVTRTPSTGTSFQVQSDVIPDDRVGTMYLSVAANALGSNTNLAVRSETVSYDTRTDIIPLTATWTYANYCETSGKVIAGVRFNKAITGLNIGTTTNTDIQITNDQKSANLTGWTLSFAGHTAGDSNTNASLAANTDLRIEATPPDDTNTNVYMLFVANSVTAGTQGGPESNTYSEVIPVNNEPADPADVTPSISIDSGTYCSTSRRIVWNAYIVNADDTELAAFTADDIMVNRSDTSITVTVTVSRTPSTGDSFRIQTSAIPTGNMGEISITVAANALGSGTNRSVTSGCVFYDTRGTLEVPIPDWDVPRYTQTGSTAVFGLRFVNSGRGTMDVTDLESEDFQVTGVASGARVTVSSLAWRITLSATASGLSASQITISGNGVLDANPVAGSGNTVFEIQLIRAASTLTPSTVIIDQSAYLGVTTTDTQMVEPYQLSVPLPSNQSGTVNLILAKNAVVASNGVRGPIDDNSSGTAAYDTRPDAPDALIATWSYASWCETSNKIIAGLRFNKAITGLNVGTMTNTDIQVTNDQKMGNLTGWTFSFAGHTAGSPDSNTNKSLAANTNLRIEIDPPANTNANVYLLINSGSVTSGMQTGPSETTYSEVISVNNVLGTDTGDDIPYLEITNLDDYEEIQTGNEITLDIDAKLNGLLRNIDGLRPEDITITSPEGPVDFAITAR